MRTVLLTGLPCSGKTTLAKEFQRRRPEWVHIDGDDVREGLCSDLKFSVEDRTENLRRVAHLAKILNSLNHNVILSFIAPRESQRSMMHQIVVKDAHWSQVFVDCPLDECIRRDVKGMYAKARAGKIINFTGISVTYETPLPQFTDISIPTDMLDIDACVDLLIHTYDR